MMKRSILLVGPRAWRGNTESLFPTDKVRMGPDDIEARPHGVIHADTVDEAQRALRRHPIYVLIVHPSHHFVAFAERLLPMLATPGGKLDRIFCYDNLCDFGLFDPTESALVVVQSATTVTEMVYDTLSDAERYEGDYGGYIDEIPPR